MKCISCLSGRNWECVKHEQCDSDVDNFTGIDDSSGNLLLSDVSGNEEDGEGGSGVLRVSSDSNSPSGAGVPVREVNTYKNDSAIRDQQSTGRKRAAVMYPLDREADCEWARQANCGGNKPIVGCLDGKQESRHHGPNKDTLNNEAGNVHRICHNCHNRWHATNDEGYVWGSLYDQHQPRTASLQELLDNQVRWSGVKIKKAAD